METKTYWCDSCFSDSTTPHICSKCGAELNDYENMISKGKFIPPVYGQFAINYGGNVTIKNLLENALVKSAKQEFQKYHKAVDNDLLLIICNDIAAERYIKYASEQLYRHRITNIKLEFKRFPYDEKLLEEKINWIDELTRNVRYEHIM
ncbi:MAG: hypothetical protein P8179_25135 [Candidatus Thiodiazotropha sp.]|jgi:hypothetical protein